MLPTPSRASDAIAPHSSPASHAHLDWPFGASARPFAMSLSGRTALLAFDGSAEAVAAARVAHAMAVQLHATVNVVSVIDTTSVPIPFPLDLAIGIVSESAGETIHLEQEREVRERIRTVLGHPIDWSTSIELGTPAAAIVRQASRTRAALIVMGLRRHGRLDRVVNDETALSVMRHAGGPVLGVAADANGLPRRALVAMDFSRASVHAAVAAARLVDAGGLLTLAYVASSVEPLPGTSEGVIHALGLDSAFDALERELASETLRVDRVILHRTEPGAMADHILEYAQSTHVDLLATGSARHGRLDRIMLGSVSTELVRAGYCSTLVVPPGP